MVWPFIVLTVDSNKQQDQLWFCYVMMFVSYCVFHNICILLDVFFEFQIFDLLCLAAY